MRFLKFPRDPLRGSFWSRCKNSRFLAISKVPARPSAGIGVVEVQKLDVFLISAVPAQRSAGIGVVEVQKLEVFLRLLLFELVLGSCLVVRAPAPGPAGRGFDSSLVARCNLHFKATCAEQLAQSNLRRPTCTDQFAQSALPRATCAEQLTQSNLHRATCTEQLAQSNLQGAQFAQSNLQGATCRDQLAGATCAEQLAQSNLHRPTCTDQFAQSTLPGAVSRLLHKCFVEGKRTHPAALGRPRLRCYAFGPTVV